MKRLLILLVALGLLVALPGTAAGKKPDNPGPSHPEGQTCAEAFGDAAASLTNGGQLVVGAGGLCVDWTTEGPATWLVTITRTGAVRNLTLTVRDSHPGDHCYLGHLWPRDWEGDTGNLTVTHSNGPNATGGDLPASTPNVCGDGYTDTYGGVDGAPGSEPYVFDVSYRGKGSVTVSLAPQEPQE